MCGTRTRRSDYGADPLVQGEIVNVCVSEFPSGSLTVALPEYGAASGHVIDPELAVTVPVQPSALAL